MTPGSPLPELVARCDTLMFDRALMAAESFDAERTLFVDDTEPVLDSARELGLVNLLAVTRPDTTCPPRIAGRYPGVERVADLCPGPP